MTVGRLGLSVAKVARGLRVVSDQIRSRIYRVYVSTAYPTVHLGENVTLASCWVRATDGGRVAIASGGSIGASVRIEAKDGFVEIGTDSFIGHGAFICGTSISIGKNALIAEYVTIRDHDHEFEADEPTALSGFRMGAIRIGDNVWIGAKATITRGVSIGNNAVVGANAVVTKNVPENCLVGGVPARVLRVLARPLKNYPASL